MTQLELQWDVREIKPHEIPSIQPLVDIKGGQFHMV